MNSQAIEQGRSRVAPLARRLIQWGLSIAVAVALAPHAPSVAAQALTPERQQITTETAQPQPELDSPSGWLAIEVAVLTDTREDTLNAERWPLFPQVRYPSVARWLKSPELIGELTARYPDAAIGMGDTGAITVLRPLPVIARAIPVVDFGGKNTLITDLSGVAGADTASVADNNRYKTDDDTDANQTFAIPLEQVDAPEVKTRAGANWLDDFESLSTPPLSAGEAEYSAADTESQAALAAPVEPPPLPEPFKRHNPSMLAAGLAALTKNTGDELHLVQAWLQPPGASNIPIVFDRSGDVATWPALQGFIELRRGSDLRMGINFWLNTDASYLPEGFVIEPPPRAQPQITVVQPTADDANAESTEALYAAIGQNPVAPEQPAPVATKAVQFIDPLTGLLMEETGSSDDATAREQLDPRAWPWRHLIHVADTRPVEENTVRYFDHPVIKVVATYRELTWGEVYELGAVEAEAAATEAALRAAEAAAQAEDRQPSDTPASQVPPGNAPIR